MALIDSFMVPCVLMERRRESDGAGGWIISGWEDGAAFDAAIVLDQSMQAKIAEKEGVTSVYTVTTKRSCALEYHDGISERILFHAGSIFRSRSSPRRSSREICT